MGECGGRRERGLSLVAMRPNNALIHNLRWDVLWVGVGCFGYTECFFCRNLTQRLNSLGIHVLQHCWRWYIR